MTLDQTLGFHSASSWSVAQIQTGLSCFLAEDLMGAGRLLDLPKTFFNMTFSLYLLLSVYLGFAVAAETLCDCV